ncbi:MAG: YbaN family protein [marine benthic group bacterium]|nr:YbaN family protein [Candidatus Benthicola marisminoris]
MKSSQRSPGRRYFPRWFLVVVGIVSVSLATLGIVVPLLPTTPFLLLAAACFVRSSDRLHRWLMEHRVYGPIIRGYREHRALPTSSKVTILVFTWAAILTSILILAHPARFVLLAPAIVATWMMIRIPTLDPALLAVEPAADRDDPPS